MGEGGNEETEKGTKRGSGAKVRKAGTNKREKRRKGKRKKEFPVAKNQKNSSAKPALIMFGKDPF